MDQKRRTLVENVNEAHKRYGVADLALWTDILPDVTRHTETRDIRALESLIAELPECYSKFRASIAAEKLKSASTESVGG